MEWLRALIDAAFYLALFIGSPIVALVLGKDWHPFLVYLRLVFRPEYVLGTLVGMCGQLSIIIGFPLLFAYLKSKSNKPTFRPWFLGVWLVVNTVVVIANLSH